MKNKSLTYSFHKTLHIDNIICNSFIYMQIKTKFKTIRKKVLVTALNNEFVRLAIAQLNAKCLSGKNVFQRMQYIWVYDIFFIITIAYLVQLPPLLFPKKHTYITHFRAFQDIFFFLQNKTKHTIIYKTLNFWFNNRILKFCFT